MVAAAEQPQTATTGATGKIAQVLGPVVDVEFPPDQLPEIYNAIEIKMD
ncbi:MAG: hypothetical protein ACRDJH_18555, partial [Thermomicrobiales bacterium]